ncbi:MAG: 3,4-dihydroxy-2-butanone-4-phosphate synthase, partial [Bacteroidales bacterium]
MSFSSIPAALAALRAGRAILVQDDHDRENEADLICAAECVDVAIMARMIRDGSGIVCLCLTPDKAAALGLKPMVEANGSRFGTAFTQSIEALEGVSTGVSAADRVTTILAALASTPGEIRVVSPGHVFPLVARAGGVLERPGHTEASVELARLAG